MINKPLPFVIVTPNGSTDRLKFVSRTLGTLGGVFWLVSLGVSAICVGLSVALTIRKHHGDILDMGVGFIDLQLYGHAISMLLALGWTSGLLIIALSEWVDTLCYEDS